MAEPKAVAGILAYLWINSDPATVRALRDRLTPAKSKDRLDDTLERISEGDLAGVDAMRLQYDPYGLLDHPALAGILSAAEQDGDRFTNPDGTARLVMVKSPRVLNGYRDDTA